MKKILLLITLLSIGILANAQSWTNFNSFGLQRKIVSGDTTWRFVGSGTNGFRLFNPDGGGATDSATFRTVANSYSLSGMQTKLNSYTLQTRSISTGFGLSGGGNLTANRTIGADTSTIRTVANSASLSDLQSNYARRNGGNVVSGSTWDISATKWNGQVFTGTEFTGSPYYAMGFDISTVSWRPMLLSDFRNSLSVPPDTRSINAGYGLLGGGNLTTDRTIYADSTVVRSWSNSLSLSQLQTRFDAKQATLVSGTNIKTIGGVSLLGSGNIPINSGTVTSFSKVDGFGIASNVTNSTTTPVHTIAVDTSLVRTVSNSHSLASLQTKLNSYPLTSSLGASAFEATTLQLARNRNSAIYYTGTSEYGLQLIGQTAATNILLAGQQGFSNGFTVKYNGTSMEYNFADGNVTAPIFIGSLNGNASTASAVSWANVTGKPTFATVATTGDYNDLINKPTLTSGTVTSITAGLGMNFTTITGTGAVNADTTVLATKANTKTLAQLQTVFNTKQNTLISGTDIKTYNGASILGSGNFTAVSSITPGTGFTSSTPITGTGTLNVNVGTSSGQIVTRTSSGGVQLGATTGNQIDPENSAQDIAIKAGTSGQGRIVGRTNNNTTTVFDFATNGDATLPRYASGNTTPTPSGTEHMVTVDANGLLGHRTIPGSAFITSVTTSGTSGPAGVVSGVLNIPTYSSSLALGTATSTTYPITNSNGTGFTLPSATTSVAGLMSASDKIALAAATPVWNRSGTVLIPTTVNDRVSVSTTSTTGAIYGYSSTTGYGISGESSDGNAGFFQNNSESSPTVIINGQGASDLLQWKTAGTQVAYMNNTGTIGIKGFITNIVDKTSNYSTSGNDYTVNCTSGTFNVTLNAAQVGQIFVVKNSGAGIITVIGTIDGGTNDVLAAGSAGTYQKTSGTYIKL